MKDIETLEKKLATIEDAISEFKAALVEAKKDPFMDPPKDWKYDSLTETEKEKIESVMRHFDFKKVHDVMDFLDWKWYSATSGVPAVPSVDELKSEAKRLLVSACCERTCVAAGGLKAICEHDGEYDDDPYVALEFILEDTEGFTDDEDDDDDDWQDRV